MHIEIHPSSDGQYYFKVIAKGNVIVTSETYAKKAKAMKAAKSLIAHMSVAPIKDLVPRKQRIRNIDGGSPEDIEANEAGGYNQTEGL